MDNSLPRLSAPAEPGWDTAFTRLSMQVFQHVFSCAQELSRRLQATGLTCESQFRQTPRGLSFFLAVVGPRGLMFVVDFTLVDGMAVARHAGAALDVRLLDACGNVDSNCSPLRPQGATGYDTNLDEVIAAAGQGLSVTALHMMAMGHYNLVH